MLLLAERLDSLEVQEQQAAASKTRSKSLGTSFKALSFVAKLGKGKSQPQPPPQAHPPQP